MTADDKVEENQLIDDQPKSSRRRSSSASDEKKSKKKKKDKGEKKGKKKDKKPKLKTIANKKLGKLTAEEKELMKHDWKEFTGDVGSISYEWMGNVIALRWRHDYLYYDNPDSMTAFIDIN